VDSQETGVENTSLLHPFLPSLCAIERYFLSFSFRIPLHPGMVGCSNLNDSADLQAAVPQHFSTAGMRFYLAISMCYTIIPCTIPALVHFFYFHYLFLPKKKKSKTPCAMG